MPVTKSVFLATVLVKIRAGIPDSGNNNNTGIFPKVISHLQCRETFHVMICFEFTRDASSVQNPSFTKFLEPYDESGSHSGSRKIESHHLYG